MVMLLHMCVEPMRSGVGSVLHVVLLILNLSAAVLHGAVLCVSGAAIVNGELWSVVCEMCLIAKALTGGQWDLLDPEMVGVLLFCGMFYLIF